MPATSVNPSTPLRTAPANAEAVRAWDTVLHARWKRHRAIFVDALEALTEEAFRLHPPPPGGRCLDVGCGFGETSRRLGELVGAQGSVLGTDGSPRFIADARRETAAAGVANVVFEVADTQVARWDPEFDYAWSRMGTQFFAAPVQAMRAIRGALRPGGRFVQLVWNRKEESPLWAESEQVVRRFLSRPDEYDADTCGPGPFSLGNPETCRGILEAAGFADVELRRMDFGYDLGDDLVEAVDAMLALGPGGELIRLNGEHGEQLRPVIAAALADHYAAYRGADGRVVRPASVWLVRAVAPAADDAQHRRGSALRAR